MAFSIFSRSRLLFRQRSFANPECRPISLSGPRAEYQAAYAFCAAAMTHEIGFDEIGIYAAYLQPCPLLYVQPSMEAGHTSLPHVGTGSGHGAPHGAARTRTEVMQSWCEGDEKQHKCSETGGQS